MVDEYRLIIHVYLENGYNAPVMWSWTYRYLMCLAVVFIVAFNATESNCVLFYVASFVSVVATVPRELPATMTRALTTWSPAIRQRIYDYCVEVARSTSASSRIADEELMLLEDTRCTS